MKTRCFLLMLLYFSPFVWMGSGGDICAQDKTIDSLTTRYNQLPADTEKVNTGLILSRNLLKKSKNQEALKYCKEIQELCATALKSVGPDKEASYKRNYAASFNLEGNVYYFNSDFQTATSCYTKALKLYEETGDLKGIANAINNIGLMNSTQANYTKAFEYYMKAMKIREQINDESGMASSYNNLAIVLEHQGNYSTALEYHFKALSINEKRGDKYGITHSLTNIGAVYSNQKNYKKAKEYYLKCLPILQEIGNKHGLANVYNNLGIIYGSENKFAEAVKYHNNALEVRQEIGDQYGVAFSYNNLGSIYFSQNNFGAALQYNIKALSIRKEIQDSLGIALSLNSMGQCNFKLGNVKEGLELCQKSLDFAKKTGEKEAMKNANKALSDIYAAAKNFEKAYFHHTEYMTLRDSLTNEENLKTGVRAEMNYEFAKKQAIEKAEREKQDAIDEVKAFRQKLILWGVSAILVLVLVFAVFAYRSYLRKQKDHAEMAIQKHIIEEKQKEILSSIHYAKRIQKVLLPQDKYIEKNISRLKNRN